MIIEQTGFKLKLHSDEEHAISIVMGMLQQLQNTMCENSIWDSEETGECFNFDDLARVIGILDGILSNNTWTELK